jgi:hypothetical protein
MSTCVKGGKVLIMVTAHATLSAGPARLLLSAREGPTPGTWRYNLADGQNNRIQYGRVAGITGHIDALRYAAGICRDAYQPGTTERGLLEQFADTGEHQRPGPKENHEQRPGPRRRGRGRGRDRQHPLRRRPRPAPSATPSTPSTSTSAQPNSKTCAKASSPATTCWVGSGRPARIAPGGFPRSSRRTRRAALTAPGAPCALTAGSAGWPGCWFGVRGGDPRPAVAVADHRHGRSNYKHVSSGPIAARQVIDGLKRFETEATNLP